MKNKNIFDRTAILIGEDGIEKLSKAKVLVLGIGGVGGYTVEALARAGVGKIDIVDKDIIDETNINRQIIATRKTLGLAKVDAMKARILDINDDIEVESFKIFYPDEKCVNFNFKKYDYIVDAVDTVTAKLDIIVNAKNQGVPVISCMGTGNKLNPTEFQVADIYKTYGCPLSKIMRKELKARNIKDVKVVFSPETPKNKGKIIGSISFVPSVAGLIIAGEVIKDLL